MWLNIDDLPYCYSVRFSSVAQSCPTLCNPMNRSTPGLPVHHQPQEFTQTNVHRVGDAVQPSHPLLSPSPPAPNPSQHQSLFQWVNSSHEWPQYWSFSFSIIPSKEHPGLITLAPIFLQYIAFSQVSIWSWIFQSLGSLGLQSERWNSFWVKTLFSPNIF